MLTEDVMFENSVKLWHSLLYYRTLDSLPPHHHWSSGCFDDIIAQAKIARHSVTG